jgi:hypothetical protein
MIATSQRSSQCSVNRGSAWEGLTIAFAVAAKLLIVNRLATVWWAKMPASAGLIS